MPPRLAGKVAPKPRQARQQMLQLRQFHLQFAFARPGALRENIQNQRRAVQHLAAENFFQIAALRGRQFVVEDHRVHTSLRQNSANSAALPVPMKVAGHGRLQLLRALAHDRAAGGGGQFGQFIQGIARSPA